jgi:hypothetical protein
MIRILMANPIPNTIPCGSGCAQFFRCKIEHAAHNKGFKVNVKDTLSLELSMGSLQGTLP